jgi:hypothetical protein
MASDIFVSAAVDRERFSQIGDGQSHLRASYALDTEFELNQVHRQRHQLYGELPVCTDAEGAGGFRREGRRMTDTTVSSVIDLYMRGFSVFAVPRPGTRTATGEVLDGKTPVMRWGHLQRRRPTEAEIAAMFSGPPMNIAIVTGTISGIVVVDADSDAALDWAARHLPYTPWQVRTAKGYHLYYRHPGTPIRNKVHIDTGSGKLAIDVRGDGGYVMGPGSHHATGAIYTATAGWTDPVTFVPAFRTAWLGQPRRLDSVRSERAGSPHRRPPAGTQACAQRERARRYLSRIPKPDIGQGADTATFKAACRLLRKFELAEADALELLDDWAGGRPGWDRAWLERKVQSAHLYGREPMGGGA